MSLFFLLPHTALLVPSSCSASLQTPVALSRQTGKEVMRSGGEQHCFSSQMHCNICGQRVEDDSRGVEYVILSHILELFHNSFESSHCAQDCKTERATVDLCFGSSRLINCFPTGLIMRGCACGFAAKQVHMLVVILHILVADLSDRSLRLYNKCEDV